MSDKKISEDEIAGKLREAEGLLGRGLKLPVVCRKIGVNEQTYHRWRKEYNTHQTKRLKDLESRNAQLERERAENQDRIAELEKVLEGEVAQRGEAQEKLRGITERLEQFGSGQTPGEDEEAALRTYAEAALLNGQKSLQSAGDAQQDGILMLYGDGNVSFWNQSAEAILGYSRREVVGKKLHTLLVPDRCQDSLRQTIASLQETQEGVAAGKTIVTVGVRKNGEEFPLEISMVLLKIMDISHVVATLRDTSERDRAHQRLRLRSSALQMADVSMLVTERNGRITWVNRAFTRLTGYLEEDVIGRNTRLFKSGRHDEAFYEQLWNTVLEGNGWRGLITNRRKDGSQYTVDTRITPLLDDRGEVSHFLAVSKRADSAAVG
jgi:PAS domain S-box-containing protein